MNTKTSFSSVTSSKDYKKTEVGLLPIDWGVAEFGDLVSYKKGFAFKSSTYEKVGVRVIRVSDTTFTDIKDEEPIFVSEKLASQCSAWGLRANDLIFTTVGSKPPMYDSLVGKAILVTEKHDGSLLNQNAVRIRAKASTKGIQTYLLNHFRTERYIEFIEMIYRGNANQASITLQNLFEFKIPLPSSETEQTAIANALSDVDALIQELEKLIAKKQAIKTATMQQLLTGRTRLPQFAYHADGRKKGYKSSELGEIPEDWEVLPFNKIFNYQNGKAQEHLFNSNDGYKVISIGNYSESGKYIETGSYIDKKHAGEISRFVLKTGELAMILNDKTAVGTIIGRVILIDKNDTYVMNQRTMRLSPTEVFNSQYLFALINSEFVHKRIVGMAKPGTQIYINTDDVLEFQVQLPKSMDEQTAIANMHNDMDKEVQTLEQRLAKTRQIKQGMMQELLTGKTRLVRPAGAA